ELLCSQVHHGGDAGGEVAVHHEPVALKIAEGAGPDIELGDHLSVHREGLPRFTVPAEHSNQGAARLVVLEPGRPSRQTLAIANRGGSILDERRIASGFDAVQVFADGDELRLGLVEADLAVGERLLGILDPLPSLREELVRGRTYFHTEGRDGGGVTRHERTDSSGDVPRTLLSRDRNSTSVSVRDCPGQYTVD